MGTDLIAEARRLASFAPEKPESVHDVVCAGFNELADQLKARTRDFLAAVERNEEKDRRIADLVEQVETHARALNDLLDWQPQTERGRRHLHPQHLAAVLDAERVLGRSNPASVGAESSPSQEWLDAQNEPGHPLYGKTWAEASQ